MALAGINLLVKERTLRVDCAGCGRRMEVSEGSAGRQGRCPGCGAPVRVPMREADPKGDMPPPLAPDPLTAAVLAVVARGDCVSYYFSDSTASVELPAETGRTQMVHLTALDEDWMAWSIVGTLLEPAQAVTALRLAETCPALNLWLNADDVLGVRRLVVPGLPPEALHAALREVARVADALEAQFFGWDRM